ncbi:MAG: FtsW/RodA/SpoVE family cell cycle protein [Bacilli bacterium]|nr:FtsW/RodA/SpoVE family cell cycle protein [Bacilli bacterium]
MLKQNIKKLDKVLLIISSILIVWGLLSIVSASSRVAVLDHNLPVYYYFIKQSVMILAGLIIAAFIINIPTSKYLKFARVLFIAILAVLLVLSFTGDETRGAQNWITIFGFTFQPSEFAKPIIIVYLAMIFDKYYKQLKAKEFNPNLIALIILIGCFIPVIVFFQKDFGTMIILVGIFMTLFLGSPIKRIDKLKTIGLLLVLVILGGLILYFKQGSIFTEAQLSRFDFINPCSNYEEGGYQICNGFIAINDGSLFGLGLGKSKQKYSYIPEPHTDSIFAIISEENGFIRSSIIFVLYVLLLFRIIVVSSKASTIRGKFICLGVATYIFMHIFINLGGLFGIMPLTGVPLPFFSYGGSFVICLIASLALVERVYIEDKLLKK